MRRRFSVLVPLVLVGCSGVDSFADEDASGGRVLGERASAIVGGEIDEVSKGVVGLGMDYGFGFMGHCTGTLIAPNVVLTARHCVSRTEGEGVVCGEAGFGQSASGSMLRVSTLTKRPSNGRDESWYKGVGTLQHAPGTDLCGSDISLIVLAGKGIPASEATPVTPRLDEPARHPEKGKRGETFSALGYGLTGPEQRRGPDTRYRLDDNQVICAEGRCLALGGNETMKTEWVGSAKTCPGDSGGPAIDSAGRVFGVLSRGPQGCIQSTYGDVGAWGEFITEVVMDAAEAAGFTAPPYWATTGSSEPADWPGKLSEFCSEEVACQLGGTCFRPAGEADALCVPDCEEGTCPEGSTCDATHDICVPAEPEPAPTTELEGSGSDGSSGCSLAHPASGRSSGSAPAWGLLGLGLAGLALRGRRRS